MSGVLWVAWPYVAWIAAIGGGLYRYFTLRYTYSSLSSQMLASESLFWGSVPWHYGILPILLAHLLAGVFPGAAAAIVSSPVALLVLEAIGLGKTYRTRRRGSEPVVAAVRDASFGLRQGAVVALVGESGSGRGLRRGT